MSFLTRFVQKLKKFDYYRRAGLATLPVAFSLLFYLLFMHSENLLLSEWFFDFYTIPALLGTSLAGATYIARAGDSLVQSNPNYQAEPPRRLVNRGEKIGTLLGVAMGMALGIGLAALHVTVPFASSLAGFANVYFIATKIADFAGLGSRIGSITTKNARLPNERIAIGVAAIIGIVMGIVFVATSATAAVSIVGVTTFFSGGAALPLWLGGVLFVSSFAGSLASCSDYFFKAINFFKARHTSTADEALKHTVKNRPYEYGGALAGVSTGALIGIAIVTLLALSQPYLFAGVLGAVAAVAVITTCMAMMGGLLARLGRVADGFKKTSTVPPIPGASVRVAPEPTLTQPTLSTATKVNQELNDRKPSVTITTEISSIPVSSTPPSPSTRVSPSLFRTNSSKQDPTDATTVANRAASPTLSLPTDE